MTITRLTRLEVDKIKNPQTGQAFYWDDKLKGFGLRVTPGSKTYIAETRVNGKKCRVKIGAHGPFSPERARTEAKSILAEMTRGTNPNQQKRIELVQAVTLEEAYSRFRDSRTLREKTVQVYDGVMRRCFQDWLAMPITQLSKDMVEKRHQTLSNANGPRGKGEAQANQAMRTLRAVLNHASAVYEDEDGKSILPENPVRRLTQVKAWNRAQRRQSVIQAHQLKDWCAAVVSLDHENMRDYLLLVLMTGLRRNEAARLKWADINFDARTLTIRADEAKNHEEHRLPLSDFLYSLLKRRSEKPAGKNAFVFPGTGAGGHMVEVKRVISKVIDQSGVQFMTHDLRRTFLTIGEALDIPHYALKRLANHKTSSDVTAGYIVTDVERLRVPMQKITSFIVENGKLTTFFEKHLQA